MWLYPCRRGSLAWSLEHWQADLDILTNINKVNPSHRVQRVTEGMTNVVKGEFPRRLMTQASAKAL